MYIFFFSSRRRHTRFDCDWSSDVCSSDLDARREQPAPAEGPRVDAREADHHGRDHPRPVGARELAAELAQVDTHEEEREEAGADRGAEDDAEPVAQRPSCARTASREAGTDVGRVADSSAVSGSLRPWPVSVSTSVLPGSMRPAFTILTRPATVAAEAGSMKMPSSRASMR